LRLCHEDKERIQGVKDSRIQVVCYRIAENGTDEIEKVLKNVVKPVDKKPLNPISQSNLRKTF
jgi:uncharacterized protein (UPF0297 family)